MKKHPEKSYNYLLAATDLSKFLGCKHVTQLDRELADSVRQKPSWTDPNYFKLEELGEGMKMPMWPISLREVYDRNAEAE